MALAAPVINYYYGGGAGIDFTSSVLSATFFNGRRTFVDQYSGGTAQIVIRNNSNQSSVFKVNTRIRIFANVSTQILFVGTVSGITYQDDKKNDGNSTATIIVDDSFSRLGRVFVENRVVTSALGSTQLKTFNSVSAGGSGPLTDLTFYTMPTSGGSTDITISGSTYTGSILQYMNQVHVTENGQMIPTGDAIYMISNSYIQNANYEFVDVALGRTASTTVMAYDTFERSNYMDWFANKAVVSPSGLAEQTGDNPFSIATYNEYTYSRATFHSTTAEALTLAENLAQKLSDQTAFKFTVSLFLEAQDSTVVDEFLAQYRDPIRVLNLTYRVPGSGTDTTVQCVIEGVDFALQPKRSRLTFYLTPATTYLAFQNFTLDTGYGVLDQDKLG